MPIQHQYIFGRYNLDPAQGILLKGDQRVALKPKVFQTLMVLVEAKGRVVTKEELMSQIWPNIYVEEGNLLKNISLLRKSLNERGENVDYIETIPKVGYRLRVPVTVKEPINTISPLIGEHSTDVLPNKPQQKSKRMIKTMGIAIVLILALAVASKAILEVQIRPQNPFENFSIIPISSVGEISEATLSPDGEEIAEVVKNAAGLSRLCIRKLSAPNLTELIGPRDVDYRGLTFSADGNFIYFHWIEKDETRTLYKVTKKGGQLSRIVNLGRSSPISFSPDGQRIAFIREEKSTGTSTLFLADPDGGSVKSVISKKLPCFFSIDERPAWSPDGTMLAYLQGETTGGLHFQAFSFDINNRTESPLHQKTWIWARQVVWLKDGGGLLVSAREKDEIPHLGLWRLNYPKGDIQRVTNELGSYESSLTLSADSAALLALQVTDSTNIWVAPRGDNKVARQITFGSAIRAGRQGIDWTPDGKIVYTSSLSGVDQIWIMNSDGSGAKQLTDTGVNQHPRVSPDGQYIFFSSGREDGTRIWRMEIDGSNQLMVTDGDLDLSPECSSDGKWLYYSSNRSGKRAIWKLPINGGPPEQVVTEPSELPAIQQAGNTIAYVRTSSNVAHKLGFYSLLDQSCSEYPYEFPGRLKSPLRWSQDGKSIQASFLVQGVANIWYFPLEGGSPVQLTSFENGDIRAFAWSRDGKQLAVARSKSESQLVLIKRPLGGASKPDA